MMLSTLLGCFISSCDFDVFSSNLLRKNEIEPYYLIRNCKKLSMPHFQYSKTHIINDEVTIREGERSTTFLTAYRKQCLDMSAPYELLISSKKQQNIWQDK